MRVTPLSHFRSGPRLAVFACAVAVVIACSDRSPVEESKEFSPDTPSEAGSGGNLSSGGALGNSGGGLSVPSGSGAMFDQEMGGAFGAPACETVSNEASLRPVYLAFAFDVSGSMGKIEDSACFDEEFKWNPVVRATTEFFESPLAEGLRASLVLFPGKDEVCDSESYQEPEVSMQPLPSGAFAGALSAYEAEVESEGWRGNTPTLAAFQSTVRTLEHEREQGGDGVFAVVLVTDGRPQGCDDDDDLERILEAVSDSAQADISTYVIGVKQPTDKEGCDKNEENLVLVDNMNAVAATGRTNQPFLIDTGDPSATQEAFATAIHAIRGQAVSCSLAIPPHPDGGRFDKDKTNVTQKTAEHVVDLPYDPECGPEGGWRYDDPQDPTLIVLCSPTCDTVRADPASALQVNFLCEPRPDVIR